MSASPSSPRRGFSLVELAIAAAVSLIVLAGVATLLQSSREVSSEQLGRIDRQRNMRGALEVLRDHLEFAGYGGLPIDVEGLELTSLDSGVALSVINNVDQEKILFGSADPDVPSIVNGTDVLIVRGAFEEPVYWLSTQPAENFKIDPGDDSLGDLYVQSASASGLTQDLTPLVEVVSNARSDGERDAIPEALLVISAYDAEVYCILELDPDNSDIATPGEVRLRVKLPNSSDTRYANDYEKLCPNQTFPPILLERLQRLVPEDGELAALGTVAVLTEYRFYVRELTAVEKLEEETAAPLPRLSRARVMPGTEKAYGIDDDTSILREDVVRGIGDLQVALGFDTAAGGSWSEGEMLLESDRTSTAEDDWLFNSPNDDLTRAPWSNRPPGDPEPTFQYVRIHGLFFTTSVDRGYQAPETSWIEDHDYEDSHRFNLPPYTTLRRDVVELTIDAKNLRRYR